MSESSDTGQASIVFLGRESFRMQVVGADAIPGRVWDAPTERIIERRKAWRVPAAAAAARVPETAAAAPAPSPAKNTIIAISLITFVSGALVATAVDGFRRHAAPAVIVQPLTAPVPTPTPMPALPALQPALVQPLPPPPAIDPPQEKPPQEKSLVAAKAIAKAPRVGPAPSLRPRRPAALQRTARAPADATIGKPAGKPPGPRQWVDPFAE